MVRRAASPSSGTSASPMCDDADRRCRGQAARGVHQRERVLLVAQMPDRNQVEAADRRAFAQPAGRLQDHAGLRALGRPEAIERIGLQHHQLAGTLQRMPSSLVLFDVAVHVGAGQDQRDRAGRARRMQARYRLGGAAGMQRDHRVAGHAVPGARDLDLGHAREKPAPARGGAPVAVVGIRQRGRDDQDVRLLAHRRILSGRHRHG